MDTWTRLKEYLEIVKAEKVAPMHAHEQLSEATHFLADRCDELEERIAYLEGMIQSLDERTHG